MSRFFELNHNTQVICDKAFLVKEKNWKAFTKYVEKEFPDIRWAGGLDSFESFNPYTLERMTECIVCIKKFDYFIGCCWFDPSTGHGYSTTCKVTKFPFSKESIE